MSVGYSVAIDVDHLKENLKSVDGWQWTDEEVEQLLHDAGFHKTRQQNVWTCERQSLRALHSNEIVEAHPIP